jgi:hypothetical protein
LTAVLALKRPACDFTASRTVGRKIMKFGALATIGFTLVFGLPAASSFFVGIIVLTTPAQADIRCPRMG